MATYCLSIAVYGPGDDPNNRSHWAIFLHAPTGSVGHMLHVSLIDRDRLWYQFDPRNDYDIFSPSSEGCFLVATLTLSQYQQAYQIISQEPAPANGTDRCQDWVLACIIALEVEEIVPPGTSEWVGALVGRTAADVAAITGDRWRANHNT